MHIRKRILACIYIRGLFLLCSDVTELYVGSPDQVFKAMEAGDYNRSVASTNVSCRKSVDRQTDRQFEREEEREEGREGEERREREEREKRERREREEREKRGV
jgi:hypothetical protein